MSELQRIEQLERVVRALHQEVGALRAELAALRGEPSSRFAEPAARPVASSPPPDVAASPPAPAWAARRRGAGAPGGFDLEGLVGRYGTIALATLAILSGAGAFLTWAISHGLLGPAQRVALGALGAAAVAGVGWWLRARGTARFGNTLLALALALLHLDLWAAGPRLHLISTVLALIITAAASIALAALALRESQEVLFCVGLGGALLAPFVTSSGEGSALLLAIYGWIVIAGGVLALRAASWRVATIILSMGCALYAGAAYGVAHDSASLGERNIPSVLALACAWTALTGGIPHLRVRLALGFLLVMLGVQLPTEWERGAHWVSLTLPLVGTLTAYGVLRGGVPTPGWRLVGASLLPLGFLAAAVGSLRHPATLAGAAIAGGWTALALVAAWRSSEERALHLATAAAASGAGILLAMRESGTRSVVALAAHAALFATVLRRWRAPAVGVPVVAALVIASLWSLELLARRVAYAYTPFLTGASAAALASIAAWWIAARELRAAEDQGERLATPELMTVLAVLPALSAFIWVRQELARAFAPDIATFLLIIYYALAGVIAIFYGRGHALVRARGVGLALACYAGIKALLQAWDISAIGLRVGSCLVVGLFIALVSYWYRVPDDARALRSTEASGD